MKSARHEKILELISQQHIETQEELADKLNRAGFCVTQATVSRDIRQMKLIKVAGENGTAHYAAMQKGESDIAERYISVLKAAFQSIENAQNLLVIKTAPGMANAAAVTLDDLDWGEILGCIAGDDTILCVTHTEAEAVTVVNKLKKMLEG